MADETVPGNRDGISIVPALSGKAQPKHEFLYWEFLGKNLTQCLQAVRMGDWKAVRLKAGGDAETPIQLFNLAEGLGEKNNVAAQHPELVARMGKIMTAAHTPSELF